MNKISSRLAWACALALGAIAATNWSTLSVAVPVNLMLTTANAPLGLVVLGLGAASVVLFAGTNLHQRVSGAFESRQLLEELRQARNQADNVEASRIEELREQISAEFRRLDDTLARQFSVSCSTAEQPRTQRLPLQTQR